MINGDMESEVKLKSATMFTTTHHNACKLVDNCKFYPQVLVATSRCIGAGLDSSAFYSVICIGFSTSILDMIQEMGRCGRNCINNGSNPSDGFYLFISLQDFVYHNERLYNPTNNNSWKHNGRVIDYDAQIQLQRNNLIKVLVFVYLNNNCWHMILERESGSPLEPPSSEHRQCRRACPSCLGVLLV